jgi:tetratricopeptide (TPR) repeat protein
MRARLLHLTLVVTALGTGACVYYNGMYNANRLARSARKAEREGRTFEANGLWGQVATKAESVIVRHPTSKYAAEAEVLRGVALSRMGQCDQALGPLSDVGLAKISPDLKEDALLAVGRCQVASGNAEAADAAFLQLLDSKSSQRRQEARFEHARLLRQSGRYLEALQALPDIRDARSDTERLLALAGAGRLPAAMAVADSLLARNDSTKHWDSLVVVLGEENPIAAS